MGKQEKGKTGVREEDGILTSLNEREGEKED